MMNKTVQNLIINGQPATQAEERMQSILNDWKDTPHIDGQQAKGKGVDCVRFVAAVLDEMRGTKTPIKHLPKDAAFHDREGAVAGMKLFIKQFNGKKVEESEPKQPGDVIVTGPSNGGPGHAIIIGPDKALWQAGTRKVIRSGWDAANGLQYKYKATIRATDRERWI